MSDDRRDSIKASVSVRLSQARAFEIFTTQIDSWWRRGPKFRQSGVQQGLIYIEPELGGRLFESWNEDNDERSFEVGRVTRWDPPEALAFTWRNSVFADSEVTQVEVTFAANNETTMVTVVHSGWSTIRADHPARHGLADQAFQRNLGMWWGDQLSSLRMLAGLAERSRQASSE